MGKAIGILLLVFGIWASLEIQTEGLEGAFGGALSGMSDSTGDDAGGGRASAAQRAGAAVEEAHRQNEERYRDMLEE